MTLREISHVLNGYSDKCWREYELAYYTAYHAGVFSQSYGRGKFPKYEKFAPRRKQSRQTWQEQKTLVMAINAAMGGKVRKR